MAHNLHGQCTTTCLPYSARGNNVSFLLRTALEDSCCLTAGVVHGCS